MVERVEYDWKLKGDLEDVKNHPRAQATSEKDVLFTRFRSKKGGDSWRKFSRNLLVVNGWIFGPKISAINMYKTFLLRNGERGCSKKEIIEYLNELRFKESEIDSIIREVEDSVKDKTKELVK